MTPNQNSQIKQDNLVTEKKKNRNLMAIRTIILVGLVVLVVFGMFLTLSYMPKVANNLSSLSKPSASTITPTGTAAPVATSPEVSVQTGTPAQTPTYIPPVSASTQQTAATHLATVVQPKTPARLLVGILSTNIVDTRSTVRFNVQNIGGSASGPWSFTATLPSNITPTYNSAQQASLAPLSGSIFILTYTPTQDLPVQIVLHTNQGTVYNY